jgi:hypothetical protein
MFVCFTFASSVINLIYSIVVGQKTISHFFASAVDSFELDVASVAILDDDADLAVANLDVCGFDA